MPFFRLSDAHDDHARGLPGLSRIFKASRGVEQWLLGLRRALARRPKWRLSRFLAEFPQSGFWIHRLEATILLALLGKELGHLDADSPLFKGLGLARAASPGVENVLANLKLLTSGCRLVQEEWIQPCGGCGSVLSDQAAEIAEAEFELTAKSLDLLGLEKRLVKKRHGEFLVRPAGVRLEQLVLGPEVRQALELALAQARHARILREKWGLGEAVSYGRGVALLFSGPPGVGKTACAEALAGALGRTILVADYSQIQSCWVGQTEQNSARVFRDARAHGALLFWDEADAMFYDRDAGTRSWEVRDVNVLLQELERFEGICVLATNRRASLDPALERRLAVKVEFRPPDREMRRAIWRKLLPRRLPLAGDVDLEPLSEPALSGGEIKNALLNAARAALARDPGGKVTQADFLAALRLERRGSPRGEARRPVGFAAAG